MRRLAIGSTQMTVGLYASNVLSLVAYGLAARGLGPASFGLVVGAFGLALVLTSFIDFGINNWTIREMIRTRNSLNPYRDTLGAKVTLAGLLAASWVTVGIALSTRDPVDFGYLPLGLYAFFAVVANTLAVPLRAEERFGPVAISLIFEKVTVVLVVMALTVAGNLNAFGFSCALALGPVASTIQLLLSLERRFWTMQVPTPSKVLRMFRQSAYFGVTGIASQAQRADVAVVAAVAGASAAGIYAAAARITSVLVLGPQAFSTALFSRTSSPVVRLRRDAVIPMLVLLSGMCVLVTAVFVAAPVLIPWILGEAYRGSVVVLRVILLTVILNTINQPMVAMLQAKGEDVFVAAASVAAAIVGLIVITAGALTFGAVGAAVGGVSWQVFVMLLLGGRMWRTSRKATIPAIAGPLPSPEIK